MKSKNPFFLTKSIAFRYLWLLNFALKLPNYAALFGIPEAWVTEITANSSLLDMILKLLENLRKAADNVVLFRDGLMNQDPIEPNLDIKLDKFKIELETNLSSLPNVLNRAISVGELIVNHPLATTIIKEDLKLVKPTETEAIEATGNPHTAIVQDAPVIKAKIAGNIITLTIIRGKPFKGLMAKVFVSRTDSGELAWLNTTNKGSLTDRATFAEGVQLVTYTYQAQMMNGDVAVGNPSEPLTVVVKRPLGE